MKAAYDPGMLNELFARVGVLMKKVRGGFWAENTYGIRYSRPFHHGKPEAGLWFRTRGCGFDRVGGCVMCDYGAGPDATSSEDMISYVAAGLRQLPPDLFHLLVSPLGSFLDEWEVPEAARLGILDLMQGTDHESFSFESRAETVSDEMIAQCYSALDKRPLKVYIGLESSNPWISKYCINKALSTESFDGAIRVLKRNSADAIANVILGSPFLSPREQVDDAVRSIQWAFARGAREVCFFPIHVKNWTSMVLLYRKGLYSSPSLWSYIEVLRQLGAEACSKIELSWYSSRKYKDPNLISSPTTCPLCYDVVIDYLDEFDETADYACIDRLVSLDCHCKELWRNEMNTVPGTSIIDRVVAAYELIGQDLLSPWWRSNRERILNDLRVEAAAFPEIMQAV